MNGYNQRQNNPERINSSANSLYVQNQTSGFEAKRQFRLYREFSAATVIKLVFAKPFYLTSQVLYCDAGNARAVISQGGTEGGSFTALTTKFGKYLLDGPVVGNTTATVGGTIAGSTEREVIRAASGAGVGIVNASQGVRALAAGTYYISIGVTGTTSGVYSVEWEELP
jgi:hypothetical protein